MSSALADVGRAAVTGDPILAVSGISVEYATKQGNVRAVDDVSFDLGRGEFIGIVGESGCGKSTLLFAIAQLLSPPAGVAAGSVVFKGTSMVGLTDSQLAAVRWKDMSVVMQSAMNALNPVTSIGAQFKDAMRVHGVRSKAEIADRSPICSLELTPCARIASLNWAPIDFTGLSAFIALCMTTDRSFQRTAASTLSVSPTRLRPWNSTPPPVMLAGGASSWAMANSSVDLPQPDSPTIARNSAGSSSKLTRSTATTAPWSIA